MTNYLDSPSTDAMLSDSPLDLMGRTMQADGKKYIYCRAGAALTKNTPYTIQYEGGVQSSLLTCDPVAKAPLNTAVKQIVVVPVRRDLADNDSDWLQYQGVVEDLIVPSATYVAGRSLKLDAGAVTEIAAAPTNLDTEFASVQVGGTTVTAIDVFLFGREALTET